MRLYISFRGCSLVFPNVHRLSRDHEALSIKIPYSGFRSLATANEYGSQITCYPVHGGWLFITRSILNDHAISVQHLVLQELRKPRYVTSRVTLRSN